MMIREESSNSLYEDDNDSSSNCSSSVDEDNITVVGDCIGDLGEKGTDKGCQNNGVAYLIVLRNYLLALVAGMGLVLSVTTHVCLSRLGNMEEASMEKVSSTYAKSTV